MPYYSNYTQPNYGAVNYGGYQAQPNYPQQPMQQVQPVQTVPAQAVPQNVNKIYVTSLEDALGRFANVNTITVYHLQDESAEIEVATDGFGKKSYKMRKLSDFSPVETKSDTQAKYVTEEQFSGLENRIKALETKLNKTTKNTSSKKAEAAEAEENE